MYEMTNLIDPEIPDEILKFNSTEKFKSIDEWYKVLKIAYDVYIEDHNKFPNQNTIDYIDIKYDEDKDRFYSKYVKFAQKCKEMEKELSISGYGGVNDMIKIKIRDISYGVDYNFPYGWKHYV